MNKKWTTSILAIVVACTTLFVTAIPAFAMPSDRRSVNESNETGKNFDLTLGEKVSADLGRAAIVMPKSPYSGELDLSHLTGSRRLELHGGSADFVLPAITWTVDNAGNDKQVKFDGGTWVSFYLDKGQLGLWNASNPSIYFHNTANKSWTRLATTMRPDSATGGAWFMAKAPNFGTYGLGMSR